MSQRSTPMYRQHSPSWHGALHRDVLRWHACDRHSGEVCCFADPLFAMSAPGVSSAWLILADAAT
eukprot:363651-Chlamydomonas_euryale.AAC.2